MIMQEGEDLKNQNSPKKTLEDLQILKHIEQIIGFNKRVVAIGAHTKALTASFLALILMAQTIISSHI